MLKNFELHSTLKLEKLTFELKAVFALCDVVSSCVIYQSKADIVLSSTRYPIAKELISTAHTTLKREIAFAYLVRY